MKSNKILLIATLTLICSINFAKASVIEFSGTLSYILSNKLSIYGGLPSYLIYIQNDFNINDIYNLQTKHVSVGCEEWLNITAIKYYIPERTTDIVILIYCDQYEWEDILKSISNNFGKYNYYLLMRKNEEFFNNII